MKSETKLTTSSLSVVVVTPFPPAVPLWAPSKTL